MAYNATQGRGKYAEFPQLDSRSMRAMMDCMSVCSACAKKCLEEGHGKTAALCAQCADICSLAIKSTSCQSEFQQQINDLCAQVSKRCADECQKMQATYCQECSQACKECAEACSTAYSMR